MEFQGSNNNFRPHWPLATPGTHSLPADGCYPRSFWWGAISFDCFWNPGKLVLSWLGCHGLVALEVEEEGF